MKPLLQSRYIHPASDRISYILGLVGPALLLPWPAKSKGGQRKWKHLELSDMDEPSHLAKLAKAGNIGIALGKVSNGLVTIDLDQDRYVDAFLAANPLLTNTLRTRGSRGCNIWVQVQWCIPRFPKAKELVWRGDWRVASGWESNDYRRNSSRWHAVSVCGR